VNLFVKLHFWCPRHKAPLVGRPTWFPVDEDPDDMSIAQVNNESSPGGWIPDASEMFCVQGNIDDDTQESDHFTSCTGEWTLTTTDPRT
jgi:hypothetical protein